MTDRMESNSETAGQRIEMRPMTESDIPAGMRLREIAGWNQTAQDWRRFLQLEPEGCFVAVEAGTVRGTATTLRFGERFGWIGMILVDPEARGRGIGTCLLKCAIQRLEATAVETQKLDATPMGHSLYLQLGFCDEYQIERWQGVARPRSHTVSTLPPMNRDQLQHVCGWDREVFGADRTRLLTALWEEGPDYSAIVCSGREIAGYMLGRAGSRASYLGPWIAMRDSGAAEPLFAEFTRRFEGRPVFVDVNLSNSDARAIVLNAGYAPQRPLTRMYRGPNRFPGRPALVYSIAGPELG
jgi:GNAT superfamily N-acetyltransferase